MSKETFCVQPKIASSQLCITQTNSIYLPLSGKCLAFFKTQLHQNVEFKCLIKNIKNWHSRCVRWSIMLTMATILTILRILTQWWHPVDTLLTHCCWHTVNIMWHNFWQCWQYWQCWKFWSCRKWKQYPAAVWHCRGNLKAISGNGWPNANMTDSLSLQHGSKRY